MAQTIKLKRSNTAGNLPTTSDLALGEVAINTKDGKLFLRKHVDGTDSGDAITMYAPQGLNTYGTQTYTVKVDSKSAAHPQNGTGSSNGYFIDGLESPFILLIPGNTYKFDQADSSNSGHPLRFYLEEDKTTAYTTGVTTNGTAGSSGAYTQIAVTTTTPQILYYQCSSHAYMGSGAYAITDAIAANAVTATQIAANSVTTSELATDAVQTLNITDANVTEAKLGSGAVTEAKIGTGAVTTDKIGANAVTSAKIATNAVGSTEIAQNSILTKHIDDNQIGIDQLNVTDGTSGQALTTDGAGTLSFSTVASSLSGASDTSITTPSSGQILVYDGTDSFDNVSISGDATLDNTGALTIATNAITSTMIAQNSILTKHIDDNQIGIDQLNVTDGTSGQVLTTDGAGTLSFSTVSSGSASDSFKTIAISGQSDVVADSSTDTLTLAAGTGITLTTNASTDTITITGTTGLSANSVTATEIATGAVGSSELAATTVTAGSYTNADITVDADGRITSASNGTSSGLSANSVTATEIATGAVGASELASTGVSAGTYGSATASPQITVDADGRLTSVSNVTISGGSGGGGVGLNQTISQFSTTGDGSTTAFNTSVTITNENLTWIFIDGVYQQKGSYSTSASTVTFSAAPPNGSTIEVMILESITTGGAFGHNAFSGDGSTTDFTLAQTPTGEGDVIAFIDGVYQNQDSFTLSGSDIQFDTAPSNNTKVIVYVVGGVVTGKTQIVDTFSGSTLITAGSPYNCTLSINPVKEENTNVYIGGVYQPKSTYSLSGTTLTLDAAPPSGTNNIEVVIGQVTTTTDVGANAVNSAAIATNAVGSTEIAQNSILTKHIDDAQVTADQLASDAVTTAKILDGNVTTAKIADNAITSAKIAANTILASELAQNILTASEITRLIPDTTDVALPSNLSLGDTKELQLGGSSELKLFNDGTNSVIRSSDNLLIQRNTTPRSAISITDSTGEVALAYGGSTVLQTSSTGIEVTGTSDADTGILTTHSRAGVGYTLRLNNTNNGANKGSGVKWSSGGFDTGAIIVRSDAAAASGDAPAYMTFHTSADGTEGVNERMRIDSSGNIGIGTSSPDTLTHIAGAAGSAVLRLENTDSFLSDGEIVGKIEFETQDSGGAGVNAYIQGVGVSTNGATRLDFGTGGQNSPETRMTINSNGHVGIGTTSITNNTFGPTTYFGNSTSSITGDSSSARFWLGNNWYYNSGDKFIGTGYANLYTQQSGTHQFLTSTASGSAGQAATFTNVLTIDANGNVGIGTSSPSSPNGFNKFIEIEGSSASLVLADNDATTWEIGSAGGNLKFFEGTDTFMIINTSGNVGIGTSNPTGGKLHVVGDVFAESGSFYVGANGVVASDSTNRNLSFGIGNTTAKMTLDTSGRLHLGSTIDTNHKGLTISKTTNDSYTPSSFNNESLLRLYVPNAEGNYAGITYTHNGGTEFFTGLVRVGATSDITDYVFQGYNGNSNAYQEYMRIDSSGDLRVGTSSLGFHFDISTQLFSTNFGAGGNLTLACTNVSGTGNGGEIFLGGSSRGDSLRNVISFRNGSSSEKMRIDEAGVILRGTTTRTIGTLGDVNALGISGNSGSVNPMVVFAETDSTVEASSCILELAYSADTSFSSAFYTLFADSGGTQGTISGTGAGTVSYNTSSDERIKENIVDTGSQLETIKQIQVKDFNYIGKNTTTTGMIAQELNAIIPNVVVEGGDDATKHPWGIDYGKLTPYLIKAIQELSTELDAAKARITELEE